MKKHKNQENRGSGNLRKFESLVSLSLIFATGASYQLTK